MKSLKTLLIVGLISVNALPALAFTEITSAPEFVLANSTLDVSKGCILLTRAWDLNDNDAEIKALSEYLSKKGYYNGNPVQGYTKAIKASVSKFQKEKGIITNTKSKNLGVMTAATREFIANDTCKKKDIETPKTSCVYITRSLNTGISNNPNFSDDTRALQRFLVQKGYMSNTFVTGSFGPITKEAVRRFQLDNGIIKTTDQEGAGELGPRTREFIQLNTCGEADVDKTTDPTKVGYRVSLSTRTGVNISTTESQQILRINIKPQEQNAEVKSLTVEVDAIPVASSSAATISAIDSIELYTKKGDLISKTNTSTKVGNNVYQFKLEGSKEILNRNQDHDLIVKVKAKSSELNSTMKNFRLFVPTNGLKVEFSDAKGNVKGVETWGGKNDGQISTFSIGKAATTGTTGSSSTAGSSSDDTTDEVTETPVAPVVKTPELKAVNPDSGSFGANVVLRGSGFEPLNNKVRLVHPQTGAVRIMAGLASRDNKIEFPFLGKKGEMTRPNGKKVSGLTGNYRISVISNNLESNQMVYRIVAN